MGSSSFFGFLLGDQSRVEVAKGDSMEFFVYATASTFETPIGNPESGLQ